MTTDTLEKGSMFQDAMGSSRETLTRMNKKMNGLLDAGRPEEAARMFKRAQKVAQDLDHCSKSADKKEKAYFSVLKSDLDDIRKRLPKQKGSKAKKSSGPRMRNLLLVTGGIVLLGSFLYVMV